LLGFYSLINHKWGLRNQKKKSNIKIKENYFKKIIIIYSFLSLIFELTVTESKKY